MSMYVTKAMTIINRKFQTSLKLPRDVHNVLPGVLVGFFFTWIYIHLPRLFFSWSLPGIYRSGALTSYLGATGSSWLYRTDQSYSEEIQILPITNGINTWLNNNQFRLVEAITWCLPSGQKETIAGPVSSQRTMCQQQNNISTCWSKRISPTATYVMQTSKK